MSYAHLINGADYSNTREQQEALRVTEDATPEQAKDNQIRLREEMYRRRAERQERSTT